MRKIFLLGALGAVAAFSLGCAFTDYLPMTPSPNLSHGVIDGVTSDRIANTQQTFEPATRDLFFIDDPNAGGGFGPHTLTDFVDFHTAKEWNRFIGTWVSATGAGIGGSVPQGQWEMAGCKPLADGSIRIWTHFSPVDVAEGGPFVGFPAWSCGFGGANYGGLAAGPEGCVVGSWLTQFGALPGSGYTRSYQIETVAIDRAAGLQWGSNLVATSIRRATSGYSTMVGGNARFGEQRLSFTPITRRGENAVTQFLNGQVTPFEFEGYEINLSGQLQEDGSILATLHGITALANGETFQAGENPVTIRMPELFHGPFQVQTNTNERLALAQWALRAGVADRTYELGYTDPNYGFKLPPISLQLSADAIQHWIDTYGPEGEGDPGFGG